MNEEPRLDSKASWAYVQNPHRCGYCKNRRGNFSQGMEADKLKVAIYQELLDRGWRRSGKYCYKPTMDKTCCPHYTIKCDAENFAINKSHKKVIKKLNKFVGDGTLNKLTLQETGEFFDMPNEIYNYEIRSKVNIAKMCDEIRPNIPKEVGVHVSKITTNLIHIEKILDEEHIKMKHNVESKRNLRDKAYITNSDESFTTEPKKIKKYKDGLGADLNKPLCKKAKLLRLERKRERNFAKGEPFQLIAKKKNVEKTLTEFLDEIPHNPKHQLRLNLVSCQSKAEFEKYEQVELALYKKYQMTVHEEPLGRVTMENFKDFLVYSPLMPEPFPQNADGPGYGSFHHQYWLDDKLIAVGVIDILPKCVSSVYFFYDPDFRDLTLGTYGSLQEINLTKCLHTSVPTLKYYYMGYYIHSCPKMRYKGKLKPSFLLCPETYTWIPIEDCLPKLDVNKYSRLNENIDAIDENHCSPEDINEITLTLNGKRYKAFHFLEIFEQLKVIVENIGLLVGKNSSKNIEFEI